LGLVIEIFGSSTWQWMPTGVTFVWHVVPKEPLQISVYPVPEKL